MRRQRTVIEKNLIKAHIIEHRSLYMVIFAIFIITFTIGVVNVAFMNEEIKNESQNYIIDFATGLKEKEIDRSVFLKEALLSNLKLVLFIWVFGLVIIGIPLIFAYVALYSYSLGFTVTTIINSIGNIKGSIFITMAILPKEIIMLPILFMGAVNAILFSKAIFSNRSRGLKREIAKYLLLLILMCAVAVLVAFFETYIGINLAKFVI